MIELFVQRAPRFESGKRLETGQGRLDKPIRGHAVLQRSLDARHRDLRLSDGRVRNREHEMGFSVVGRHGENLVEVIDRAFGFSINDLSQRRLMNALVFLG